MGANTDLVRWLRTETTLLVAKKKKSSVFDFVVTTDASCNQGAAVGCAHVLDVKAAREKTYLFWHGPVVPGTNKNEPSHIPYSSVDTVSAELATIRKTLCRLPLGSRVEVRCDQRFLQDREYEQVSLGNPKRSTPHRGHFRDLLKLIHAFGLSVSWRWVTDKSQEQFTKEYKYCHNACKRYVRALTDYRGRASIPA